MPQRAHSIEEYVKFVDQLGYDLDDLRDGMAYDAESGETDLTYIDVLIREVKALRALMADGSYQFGKEDLPFMRVIKHRSIEELPFIRTFYIVNQTHLEGLDVPES